MNMSMRFFFALWLIVAGSVGSPTPCSADTLVTLKGETELDHPTVKLSDLFVGVPDGIDRDIAQAPAPGRHAVYDSNLLAKLADKYRLEWHSESGPDHVVVSSGCTKITNDAIREAIVQKIKDGGVKGIVEVNFDGRSPEINLPAKQSTAFTLSGFDYDQLTKRFHTDLITETGEGPATVPLAGRIMVKRHVPVLTHKLEGGTVIGLADVDWIDVAEDRVNDSVVTDAQQLVGRELRHTTSEDELLHNNDVLPPRLVTRGSLVTMKIETPAMVVTAQGKSLQDGALGDVVRIINTASNRMIEGTVTEPGTVTVVTGQKLALVQ